MKWFRKYWDRISGKEEKVFTGLLFGKNEELNRRERRFKGDIAILGDTINKLNLELIAGDTKVNDLKHDIRCHRQLEHDMRCQEDRFRKEIKVHETKLKLKQQTIDERQTQIDRQTREIRRLREFEPKGEKRNYQIVLRDNRQFQIDAIEKFETEDGNYVFTDAAHTRIMTIPKSFAAFVQDITLIQSQPEQQIEPNNLPPTETPQIMRDGKRVSQRWHVQKLEDEKGKAHIELFDSALSLKVRIYADEKQMSMVDGILQAANSHHQTERSQKYEKGKEPALKIIIEDVDDKPVIAIDKKHWQTLIRKGEYRITTIPVMMRGKEQFRVVESKEDILLTRCVMRAYGSDVHLEEQPVPVVESKQ